MRFLTGCPWIFNFDPGSPFVTAADNYKQRLRKLSETINVDLIGSMPQRTFQVPINRSRSVGRENHVPGRLKKMLPRIRLGTC